MFERVAQTEAEKDAEAAIGRSPDQIAALRLAAMPILANFGVTIALVIAFRGESGVSLARWYFEVPSQPLVPFFAQVPPNPLGKYHLPRLL